MERDRTATAFVTGGDGFIGSELIRVLTSSGHPVVALSPSMETARHARRAGAVSVLGDLLEPGQWQDEAAADWVFHLPDSPARTRMSLDAHLLDAVAGGATRRIVYVADASWYGATGARPITEDAAPKPSRRARRFLPTLNRLGGYIVAGLPIVIALPGCVYGNGSWFDKRIAEPILGGRRVVQFGTGGPWVSPIHVHDCARALVHLAEHGEPGSQYFLVNDDPVQLHEFAETFARLANRSLRLWRLPGAARLVIGTALGGPAQTDAVFSNIRLRGLGFRFRYPTLEQGLAQVIGALDE
jgi:nucleoside-diphosphate-sugar epimerase